MFELPIFGRVLCGLRKQPLSVCSNLPGARSQAIQNGNPRRTSSAQSLRCYCSGKRPVSPLEGLFTKRAGLEERRSTPTFHKLGAFMSALSRPSTGGLGLGQNIGKRYASGNGGPSFGDMSEEEYLKSEHRFQKLPAQRVRRIFGPGMSEKQGNYLLDTLQKQRVTGTLDHDIEGPAINKVTLGKALRWLRETYPLDEDAAIMGRIEREEAEMNTWKPQQSNQSESVYGDSQFDKLRAYNEEQARLREEAEKAAAKKLEEEGSSGPKEVTTFQEKLEIARGQQSQEWIKKYKERARLSAIDETPELSNREVLLPSTIFAVCVIIATVMFAAEYTPPSRDQRLFPEVPPAAATVGAIIAINVAVWLMWKAPPMWRIMNMNFLMIPASMNPVSLLGNVFSHQNVAHLAANMAGLWFLGTTLCDEVGRGRFLAIYLCSGVFGSWLSLVRFVVIRQLGFTALGASGAVMGTLAAFCWLYPNRRITSPLFPAEWQEQLSLQASVILALLIAFELASIYRRSFAVDHVAHLGGMISGVIGAEAVRLRARARHRQIARSRETGARR